MFARRCGTVIIGGGPAALAPLISASREGRLQELLAKGVVIIEQGSRIGDGRLGNYAIWSDSTALTFLSAVTDDGVAGIDSLRQHPIYAELSAMGHGAIPLTKAAELMRLIGECLHAAILRSGGRVLLNHKALSASQRDGGWLVHAKAVGSESELYVEADSLVVATGGHQLERRLASDPVAGTPLYPKFAQKLFWSDEVLQQSGADRLFDLVAERSNAPVAIVGGSTSALATADMLLRQRPSLFNSTGSIAILHRRPLRVFYTSKEDALADNYTDFSSDDICPISGFVYRLAGFRLHSRDLLMRIMGIGGRQKEERVLLHRLSRENIEESQALLEDSVAVIAATGYRPRAIQLFDEFDEEIALMSSVDRSPLVDSACRMLDQSGRFIPNAYAIGLAAGFVPSGKLGGEKSFIGQANGLWLWQNAVGSLIVEHLLASRVGAFPSTETTSLAEQVLPLAFAEASPSAAA